ncbi:MAG: sigma-70 family RNA polymerase sigma factor [Planctomycetota bacterium]|nr:sigma-70 family RNA polymerase sigma factor [Planctomycetota bacterium]MDA0921595.1 sigma-70 family RNA polymerase sigma factor [Planctomycetota bacterium]
MSDVTRILSAIDRGDEKEADQLLPLVYQELRKLAAAKLSKEKRGHSIQATMLVHEAYVRLVDVDQQQGWSGRRHFFAAASEAMRRILIENARRKLSLKRGGEMARLELGDVELAVENSKMQQADELLALDEALTRFEQLWPEKAQFVKLRYFAGMTVPEAAQALDISVATAERYWKFAKAWLHSQLKSDRR